MITIRGAIAPPDRPRRPKPDADVSDATRELREPAGGGFEHLVGHGDDVVVGELAGHRVGHHRFEHQRAVAGDRGLDGPLLHHVDAAQELAHDPGRSRVVAAAHARAVGDAHDLDHRTVGQVRDVARVRAGSPAATRALPVTMPSSSVATSSPDGMRVTSVASRTDS